MVEMPGIEAANQEVDCQIEIDADLYDELCIQAERLNCTPEEVLEQVVIWLLESAPPGTLREAGD